MSEPWTHRLILGDCLAGLRTLPDASVQCCVTSPPYYGLRDYGETGQIGLERTPDEYVERLVSVFREVRRVLPDDGVLWLNLGDSYYIQMKGSSGIQIKPKELLGVPWRVAFALQADGWYLRQDIIWHKPNPMPESVRDRCTKAHEYLFLLTKGPRYYWDANAMQEPVTDAEYRTRGKVRPSQQAHALADPVRGRTKAGLSSQPGGRDLRNRRSVWTVPPKPYKGAHFAVFPPALIEPCILAGSRPGDIVLDPFIGSGTTAEVALKNGRGCIGIDMNAGYLALARERIADAKERAA